MLWDTDREREINLGTAYPYEPMEKGECILPYTFANRASVGDLFEL